MLDAGNWWPCQAHVDGRTAAKVAEYIAAQPDSWRAGVTHVTIDPSAPYLGAVTDALPHAVGTAARIGDRLVTRPVWPVWS